jgi:hypothetical protein
VTFRVPRVLVPLKKSQALDKLEWPAPPSLTCHVWPRFITLEYSFFPCSHLSLQRPVSWTAPFNYERELMISISEVHALVRLYFVLSISKAFPAHRWIPKKLAETQFSGTAPLFFNFTPKREPTLIHQMRFRFGHWLTHRLVKVLSFDWTQSTVVFLTSIVALDGPSTLWNIEFIRDNETKRLDNLKPYAP